MSNTRTLTKKLQKNKTTPIKYAKPTKALLICSMSCEEEAAGLRNLSVDDMKKGDIKEVAYRYLQARLGESKAFAKTITCVLALTVLLGFFYLDNYKLNHFDDGEDYTNLKNYLFLFFALSFIAHFLPNYSNIHMYKETKKACEEWLSLHLNKDSFDQIKKLPSRHDSFFKLDNILNISLPSGQAVRQKK